MESHRDRNEGSDLENTLIPFVSLTSLRAFYLPPGLRCKRSGGGNIHTFMIYKLCEHALVQWTTRRVSLF